MAFATAERLYGAFVQARRALNSKKRRLSARAEGAHGALKERSSAAWRNYHALVEVAKRRLAMNYQAGGMVVELVGGAPPWPGLSDVHLRPIVPHLSNREHRLQESCNPVRV